MALYSTVTGTCQGGCTIYPAGMPEPDLAAHGLPATSMRIRWQRGAPGGEPRFLPPGCASRVLLVTAATLALLCRCGPVT